MAGGNLSPRQKMINMMYLVLTALLALNVSKEVLNSFFEVNLGIVKTTESLDEKSNSTYSALDNFNNKVKSAPYIALVSQVEPKANLITDYIQEMKYDLVFMADRGKVYLDFYEDGNDEENIKHLFEDKKFEEIDKTKKIAFLNAKDNRESSGHLFNPENRSDFYNEDGLGRASILKNHISEFKTFLLDILNQAENSGLIVPGSSSQLISEINNTLDIKDGKEYGKKGEKVTWEIYNFYDMPAVGALTILSKWQADMKNIEAEVVSFIASSVSASDLKFTSAMATTIPSSTFVISGDEFSSKIFLTAYDETAKPQIYIGDYEILADSTFKSNADPLDIVNGQGIYTVKTRGTGPKSYKGFIKIPQENEDKFYPFEGEYTVAKSTTVVSPDYMTAMFKGTENPVSISVPGYDSRDLTVRFDAGSIKGSKGKYIATPKAGGGSKGVVSVYGPNSKGKKVKLGSVEFDLYDIPAPLIYLPVSGDKVSTADIINAGGLRYKKEGMLKMFKGIKYSIKSFDVIVQSGSTGGSQDAKAVKTLQTGKARKIVSSLSSGDYVLIKNIKFKVNGKTRTYKNEIGKQIK